MLPSMRRLSVLLATAVLATGCPRSEVRPEGGTGDLDVLDSGGDDLAGLVPDADTRRAPEVEVRSLPGDVEETEGTSQDGGPGPASCVYVNPANVNFGGKLPGQTAGNPIEISCCGDEPLLLYGIGMAEGSSPDFALDLSMLDHEPSAAAPLAVLPGEAFEVYVTFTPGEENPVDESGQIVLDEGIVVIDSNAGDSPTKVPVSGAGVIYSCPTPVITVDEGEEVCPGTLLHLKGDGYSPNHTITKWEWDVEQPIWNQGKFIPSASFPNPTFQANVAGEYTFYLTVYDETNTPSCFPAVYTVIVTCSEPIHVELLWQTPGDPDETDTGPEAGSNLDLHFVHPYAQGPDRDGDGKPDGWFDIPWDCFWFNPHPNWGSADPAVDDDPYFDIDDVDGAGPENINLMIPENVQYRVGVHYWCDNGFGPALATVRVYIYSQLVFEVTDVQLASQELWEVCTIDWPSGKVNLSTGKDGGYKIHPDYADLYFVPGDGC